MALPEARSVDNGSVADDPLAIRRELKSGDPGAYGRLLAMSGVNSKEVRLQAWTVMAERFGITPVGEPDPAASGVKRARIARSRPTPGREREMKRLVALKLQWAKLPEDIVDEIFTYLAPRQARILIAENLPPASHGDQLASLPHNHCRRWWHFQC